MTNRPAPPDRVGWVWPEWVSDPFPPERVAEVRAELAEILDIDDDDERTVRMLAEVDEHLRLYQVGKRYTSPFPWKTRTKAARGVLRAVKTLRTRLCELSPVVRDVLDDPDPPDAWIGEHPILPALEELERDVAEFIAKGQDKDGRSRPRQDALRGAVESLCNLFLAAGGAEVAEGLELPEDGVPFNPVTNLARDFVRVAFDGAGIEFSEDQLSRHISSYLNAMRKRLEDSEV